MAHGCVTGKPKHLIIYVMQLTVHAAQQGGSGTKDLGFKP